MIRRTALRVSLILSAGALVPIPAFAGASARWHLSSEPDYAYEHTAPPFVGERDIYLWLVCYTMDGVETADMDLIGSLEVLDFVGTNGVTNSGTLSSLQLDIPGCVVPVPFLAGAITVQDSTGAGGSLCLGGMNVTGQACSGGPTEAANSYFGFSTDGTGPCTAFGCVVEAVEGSSWGRIKSFYPPQSGD